MGALILASMQIQAQVKDLGQPISWKNKTPITKNQVVLPAVDNAIEATAEYTRRATSFEKNLRFGKEMAVSIDFMSTAQITILPNGDVMRQLLISSPGAFSVNMIFDQFKLAPNARLYLSNDDFTEFIGAHTSLNNNSSNVMGTELIHDDKVLIELVEPASENGLSVLHLGTVIHGYLDLEAEVKALNSSGSCEYDVNCPIGAGWENQRNSVAMMVNGGGFCTGSLVNNTSGTIIPYFLSANHCGTTPASWVFRFRWESPAAQADCATSAPSVNGPTTMNVNGGVLKASYAPSDFTLTLLNTSPDPAWGIYYNGWNRTNIPANSAVGIHHPAGDIKKISFEYQPLISTTFGTSPADSHWGVTQWDEGVTEGGSSGSPLFDENHRTVGQLHGGASACGNASNALSDEYGKFYMSWTGGGADNSRLSNWLDPSNTAATVIDGVDPAGPALPVDAGMSTPQGVSGTFCSSDVTPSVTITNNGTDVLTSATINYGYDGATNLTYNWTGSLNQYQTEVVALPTATLAGGAHTFQANVSNPNGATDGNALNNSISSSFTTVIGGQILDLSIQLDCYGSECSWALTDTLLTTTFYTGGPYSDNSSGGPIVTQSMCVNAGCYTFTINDSYGDGLTSAGCAVPAGNYSLMDAGGTTLAGLTAAEANFGTTNAQQFCFGSSAGISAMNDLQNAWVVYPNPTDNVLSIVLNKMDGAKTIQITTTTGQEVRTINSNETQSSFEVSGLAKGVYFVRLMTAQGTSTKTFVVK